MDSLNDAYTREPGYGSSGEFYKPQIKTEKEANYIQVRSRASRGRHTFFLIWPAILEAEYQAIEEFFNSHIGAAFYWTNKITNVTHTVVFSEDRLKYEFAYPRHRKLTLTLEEM